MRVTSRTSIGPVLALVVLLGCAGRDVPVADDFGIHAEFLGETYHGRGRIDEAGCVEFGDLYAGGADGTLDLAVVMGFDLEPCQNTDGTLVPLDVGDGRAGAYWLSDLRLDESFRPKVVTYYEFSLGASGAVDGRIRVLMGEGAGEEEISIFGSLEGEM